MTISIDYYTIVMSAILLAVAIITPMCSALFRRPKPERPTGQEAPSAPSPDELEKQEGQATPKHKTDSPSLSIVMTTHDQAYELEHHLPYFLQQQYDGSFEVIVVDESSTDETEDVLTRLKAEYPMLYNTYIPASSHYVSRKKLALTLGIKAAKGEWIILTDIDCIPQSDQWLATLSRYITDDTGLVLGYTGYDEQTPAYWRYDRLLTNCYHLRSHVRPYRYEGHNLALRKSLFMRHNGFLSNLKYLRGEYDFIVNEYATAENTAIAIEPDIYVRQQAPSGKTWQFDHLYYMENRRHMRHGTLLRWLFCLDQTMLYLGWLLPLSVAVYAAIQHNWPWLGVAVFCLLLTLCLRLLIFRRACKTYEESISLWKAPFLECRVVWQNAWLLIRHRLSDKYDFIRK